MLKFSNDDYATPRERMGLRRSNNMYGTESRQGARYSCDGTRVLEGETGCMTLPATCNGTASLASVYAPHQTYTGLFDSQTALCNGTLFEALYKPLRGGHFNG